MSRLTRNRLGRKLHDFSSYIYPESKYEYLLINWYSSMRIIINNTRIYTRREIEIYE